MSTTTANRVYEKLYSVLIEGHEPLRSGDPGTIDGFWHDYTRTTANGAAAIIELDTSMCDVEPWQFGILVSGEDLEHLEDYLAGDEHYSLVNIDPIESPIVYGGPSSTVTIRRHAGGFVVLK